MKELGRGGFSIVFRATHRIDGCEYALKRTKNPVSENKDRNAWLQVSTGTWGAVSWLPANKGLAAAAHACAYQCVVLGADASAYGVVVNFTALSAVSAAGGAGAGSCGGASEHCTILLSLGRARHAGAGLATGQLARSSSQQHSSTGLPCSALQGSLPGLDCTLFSCAAGSSLESRTKV